MSGCGERVNARQFLCRVHWWSLPVLMRKAIYYERGEQREWAVADAVLHLQGRGL